MRTRSGRRNRPRRRAATMVLAALMVTAALGMGAFAVDLGYLMLVRTQLQAAADSAAMAAAARLHGPFDEMAVDGHAGYHMAGGRPVEIPAAHVRMGFWDGEARWFTPASEPGNAVRVTARCADFPSGETPLVFARLFGARSLRMSASAVAVADPRDIAFVIDLSGSMNNETEPCWATAAINDAFAAGGCPTAGDELIEQVYDDFGYGGFPGVLQHLGQPFGVPQDQYAYAELTKNGGPLAHGSVPEQYRINPSDGESARKRKAYSIIIDEQIAAVMPNAAPAPDSTVNYDYWEKYLDYIVTPVRVDSRGRLPYRQDGDRIDTFGNPSSSTFAHAGASVPRAYRDKIGYRTYVQFMMDHGRDKKPDGRLHVPLSRFSPDCPWHSEATAGGTFRFPPREQPLHAARRAMIAALEVVKEHNAGIANPDHRDWVSIVAFDSLMGGGPVLEQPLTGDYDQAMQVCTRLQAVADNYASTATEAGLLMARQHIGSPDEGGQGRYAASKIIVLLTDGVPNLYASSRSEIDRFMRHNPGGEYYAGSKYAHNAALVQAAIMQKNGWRVFPVGIGLGADYDFIDRLARIGGTAGGRGEGPRASGSPAPYEQQLTGLFETILANPQVRLVQ